MNQSLCEGAEALHIEGMMRKILIKKNLQKSVKSLRIRVDLVLLIFLSNCFDQYIADTTHAHIHTRGVLLRFKCLIK